MRRFWTDNFAVQKVHSIPSSARASTVGGLEAEYVGGMEAEYVGGFEVDHQLVRQVDRFLALKDSINVGGRLPKWVEINFL